MSQADGYIRIVTQNDVSDAQRSTEQLGDTIATSMNTSPVDRMSDAIENVGSAAVSTGDIIQAHLMSDVIMQSLQILGDALKETAIHTIDMADGLDSSVKRIGAATNATEAEMQSLKKVVNDVYGDNFGDDFDDIADSVSKIKQNLGELDDMELVNVTESAYALQDLFDAGVDQSSRAARAIMQNFEVSAATAYDYMARGAQNGLDYSGELLDTISEYSVQFRKLGFTLDDMFNIMTAGAENGAWKLDTVGDLIKELSITAIDGADSTHEGFELLGLNADEMSAKFAAGGESAKQAFEETISAIAAMEDPIKQDAAGVALMKTMWEDLGKDAVLALDGITNSAYEASGAMDDIKELNYSSLSDSVDTMKRKLDLLIQPIGESLVPSIKQVTDAATEAAEAGDVKEIAQDIGELTSGTLTFLLKNVKLIGSAIAGATAGVVAFKAANIMTKVISSWQTAALQVTLLSNAQGAAAIKTAALNGTLTAQELIYAVLSGKLDIATAKQYALNTAMSLNPAGIIAISIGILATALTGFALSADTATNETQELLDSIDEMHKRTEDTIASGDAELEILKRKADRYEELRSSLDLTAAQESELEAIASELQDTFGDEIEVVNSLTGEYNNLADSIDKLIEKKRQEFMLSAYETQAKEAQQKIFDLDDKIAQKTAELEKLRKNSEDESFWETIIKGKSITKDKGFQIKVLEGAITGFQFEKNKLQADIDKFFEKSSEYYQIDASVDISSSGSGTADNERAKGEALLKKQEEAAAALQEQYKELADIFKQERDSLKYQYDMGIIDASEYYVGLEHLRDEYLQANSSEWRSVNVEVKKYYDSLSEEQQKAYEQQLAEQKKAAEDASKARAEAYNSEKAQLQFRLNTNRITEKTYYTELAKLRDKYLDKNSDAWRSAYLETYEYNQSVLQANRDTLTQLLSDASDTTLSALENITAARDRLASKLVDFNKTFEKITETVPETVAVKGEFTITTSEHEVEAYRMDADSIEDNIRVLEEYGAMLEALKARGADDSTLNEILSMDVDEAMEFGGGLLKMSEREWNSYFDGMARLRQTAEDISARYYQSEVELLRDNFVDKMKKELEGLGADMYMVGADVAAEFVAGWNEALGTKDLTLGQLMRTLSGTVDTAPKAAQQHISASVTSFEEPAMRNQNITNHVPIYIGSQKIADVVIDAVNGKIIQTGKNVLAT